MLIQKVFVLKRPIDISIGNKEEQKKFDECYNLLNQRQMLSVQSTVPKEKNR